MAIEDSVVAVEANITRLGIAINKMNDAIESIARLTDREELPALLEHYRETVAQCNEAIAAWKENHVRLADDMRAIANAFYNYRAKYLDLAGQVDEIVKGLQEYSSSYYGH